VTLVGWNGISGLFSQLSPVFKKVTAIAVIVFSGFITFAYADAAEWTRDARALAEAHSWFVSHPLPINRFIWSHPYSGILFDRDPWENPAFTPDHERNIELLRDSPSGTLAVWDEKVGPSWLGLKALDFETAGYTRLYSQSFVLKGRMLDRPWFGFGGPRSQIIYIYYKP
jgi:hypothetical protein